jgi:hypothetical protein
VGRHWRRTDEPLQLANPNFKRWASDLFVFHFRWDLNKIPTTTACIAFDLPTGRPKSEFAVRPRTLADAGIHHTWREVGPRRVRFGLPDGWAIFQLFLTDEEQFANLQLWKNLLWTCRDKLWEGSLSGNGCRFGGAIDEDKTDFTTADSSMPFQIFACLHRSVKSISHVFPGSLTTPVSKGTDG